MVRVEMGEGGTALRTVSICFSCAVMCVFKSWALAWSEEGAWAVAGEGNDNVTAVQKQRSRT